MTSTNESSSTSSLPAPLGPRDREADCTLDALTLQLAPLLKDGAGRRGGGSAKVAALLRAYAGAEDSWRRYVNFRDDTYSRNLIWRCGDFELLILCWNEGQASPIHDHSGQQCWMAVLDGELEEVHFPDLGEAGHGSAPVPGRVKAFPQGGVAFIDDDIALHLVRPKAGQQGVTLHLYSSPIDTCRVFCPESGVATAICAGYHTVRGEPAEGIDPELIRAAWCGSES
jgi:cysteine dioxygenase